MSAQISGIVREESPNNYKHVVMTMIGSVAELGFHCNPVARALINHKLYCITSFRVGISEE